MEQLELVVPTIEHKRAAEAFKQEFFDYGETVINGSSLLDQMDYDAWLAHIQSCRDPRTVREDWVVASTFFALRTCDSRIVGMIDIRHNLENDFLAEFGGHIGYAIRPGERRKGYAVQMLRQALEYAKALGLSAVMLGCYSDNLASKNTIIRCGGTRREQKPYLDGKWMEIYWIEL